MRHPAFLMVLSFAAFAMAACSPSGRETPDVEGILLPAEEVLARPPELSLPGPAQAWTAERASDLGVYYLRSQGGRSGPFKTDKASVRIVLLKGRAEVRAGTLTKACGPGAYVVVPPGTDWEFSLTGSEPALFSLLVSPDVVPLPALLNPVPKGS